jgi:hypothetical protein
VLLVLELLVELLLELLLEYSLIKSRFDNGIPKKGVSLMVAKWPGECQTASTADAHRRLGYDHPVARGRCCGRQAPT